jgi:hypothetical protein
MRIGVCIRAKDEQNIICDWVRHYLRLGFDRIFIYDNMSNPPVSWTLRAGNVPADKVVITIDRTSGEPPWCRACYKECIDGNRDLDWILLCDADEFLWLKSWHRFSIKDFLSYYPEDVSTVLINWLTFGTGGASRYDPSKSVFEQFTTREKYNHHWNTFFKSFVRPGLIKEISNDHLTTSSDFKCKNVYREDVTMEEIFRGTQRLDLQLSDETPLLMVHYMTLDFESMSKKQKRNSTSSELQQKSHYRILEEGLKYSVWWYHAPHKEAFRDSVRDTRMLQ